MIYALDISSDNFAPAKFTNISSLLNLVIPLLTLGAAIIFLVMTLWGAFDWITAGDNSENLKKAKKKFISAFLGLIIIISAFILVKLIGFILKINLLSQ
ncbi:MAG: hypothetical protein N2482_01580 [Patescibacteria group bacterium]|nr:hypothetical protein [Patescibacteria group bacterium]